MGSKRRGFLIAVYAGLLAGGLLLGRQFVESSDFPAPGSEIYLHRMIMTLVVIYILVAALPFVPASEIGLCLMLMLEPTNAVLVYTSTVVALMLAYLIGRIIPAGACATAFDFFGFRKARELILQMAALNANARLELLLTRAPARVVPSLLRHRYLALAVALNLPGNTLVGGGGGIALSAGMSGLYPMPAYIATVAIAVAPIPLLIALSPLLQ